MATEALVTLAAAGEVFAVVRLIRAGRRRGMDPWQAAEQALAQMVLRGLARLLVVEPRLAVCLARWVTGRYPRPGAAVFGYHGQLDPLLRVITALVLVEGAVVGWVLTLVLPHTPWPVVVVAVHCYSLLWLLGLRASLVIRPHQIVGDRLHVRDGVFNEVVIPLAAIRAARRVRQPNTGRSGLRTGEGGRSWTLAHGEANVRLDLDPAASATLTVNGSAPGAPCTAILLTADAAGALVAAIADQAGHSIAPHAAKR